ncbi:MAG: hypothetical protein KDJ14_05080 [Xanthomonadales bacterium]|nr:hypothetical protein [Xanthomonadales bacterium]
MIRTLRSSLYRGITSVCAGALMASLASTAAAQSTTLKSALWWIPAESGWGLYIVDQGNAIAPIWYTFDADGEPSWFLIPGAFADEDGIYRGDVYRYTGRPLTQITQPAVLTEAKIGEASFTFQSDGKLKFDFNSGTSTNSKTLEKFPLPKDIVCTASASSSRVAASNYTDLWYDPATSGWGLNVLHTDDTLLVLTWYTYDTDNEPVFYTAVTSKGEDGAFTGSLYRERSGVPYTAIMGAPASNGSDIVGSVRVVFSNGENAQFSYTVNGVTQVKPITRLQFGSTFSVCEARAAGGGGGSAGADECYPPLAVGDRYRIRSNADMAATDAEVIGTGTFDGHPVFRVRYTPVDQTSGEVIEFVEQTDSERIYYGSEGFIPEVDAVGTTRFEPPVRVPRSTPVGASGQLVYQAITQYTANGQSVSSVIDFDETYERLGNETQSSPAGTFTDACKIATTLSSDVSITTAGVTVRTQVEATGTQWAHPDIGGFRTMTHSVSTVTTSGAPFPIPPTTTTSDDLSEIISAFIGGRTFP